MSERSTLVLLVGVFALAFFLLPTQIHERYLFLTLPMLGLWATCDRRILLALGVGLAASGIAVALSQPPPPTT